MKIAIAVEVEVPDGTRIDQLEVEQVRVGHSDGWAYHFSTIEGQGIPILRDEIHADPDAVFPPTDEQ